MIMNMTDCWCCAYCVKFSVAHLLNVIVNKAVILIVSQSVSALIPILILILVKLEVSNLNL